MVLVAVSSRGPLYLKIFNERETLNSEMYLNILKDEMIPAIRRRHPNGFVFLQDGAPSHKANIIQRYLHSYNVSQGILNTAVAYGMEPDENPTPFSFIAKDDWPAYSPDLNVCDYRFVLNYLFILIRISGCSVT